MKLVENLALEIAGSILYALGIGYFISSAVIAPGGVSGIAVMINHLTTFPIGTATLIINMPIVLCGWFVLGSRMMVRTVRIILISSVLLDISGALPPFGGERLLGAVFGGLFTGAGLGIIFYSGGTTGGVDILSYILQRRFPTLKIGGAMLIIDAVIIASSMALYRELEAGLYGIISLYCTTKIIDAILYRGEGGSLVMIVSDHADEISDFVTGKISRGATMLDCRGAYSGDNHTLLLCAVRKRELIKLQLATKEIDSSAFIICMRSSNIYGEGFESGS